MFAINSIPLLLAAPDWLEIGIGLIFFILYGIGQLISASEQAKKKPAGKQKPRVPQAPPEQAPAGERVAPEPAGQADALRREVDEFLRRAQGKPPRDPEQDRPQPQPTPRKREPIRPATKRQSADSQQQSRRPPTPVETPQPTAPLREGSVAEHVATHLGSKSIADHAEHLGDEVALADDRLESRLREKFDHKLGNLQHRDESGASKQRVPSAAEEIADLLSSPSGMRQLIVAREILQRPEHW